MSLENIEKNEQLNQENKYEKGFEEFINSNQNKVNNKVLENKSFFNQVKERFNSFMDNTEVKKVKEETEQSLEKAREEFNKLVESKYGKKISSFFFSLEPKN